VLEPFKALYTAFETLEIWSNHEIHSQIEQIAARFELKLGKIAQPLRVAVTGNAVSPSIDVTIALIGRKRVLIRLNMAINYIQSRSELDSGGVVT